MPEHSGKHFTYCLLLSFQVKFQMDYATMERDANYELISKHPSRVRLDIIRLISAETSISVPEGNFLEPPAWTTYKWP